MPMESALLRPGVDVEKTPSLNTAGVSQSQLIRYKTGLIQTYGGWSAYVPFTIPSTVRDLRPWQDVAGTTHLSLAATQNLVVITGGSEQDITPQTNTTNPAPNFSISSGSNLLTVVDEGSSASVFNSVYFNTPIAIGAYLINGNYPINSVVGSSIYTILLPSDSSSTVTSSGILPVFTTTANSAEITVDLPNNGFAVIPGLFQQFIAPTTVGGLTVEGKYTISAVLDSTAFTINATQQSSGADTQTMNGGMAQLVYSITIGPLPAGSGFGAGGFGSGGFGTGTATAGSTGSTITATDWTQDNWGEILLACPENGPIYSWAPNFGTQNAKIVPAAPYFNGGIFISQPQQILVAWRSVQSTGVQDPLEVRWSDALDYTTWTAAANNSAGSFHIPTGSIIVGGIQAPTFGIISTDVDVWVMQYVGGDVIFNFTRVGTGCAWISSHACGILAGAPYWCGASNFYTMGSSGVTPIPCPVWDTIFQNLSIANKSKIRCGVNSAFNEVTWYYPSSASAGENDSYVKVHIEGSEYEWDYGTISRTAWTDISVLGNPIGTDLFGAVYQHETGVVFPGASAPSFRSGWWAISDGNDLAFVDWVLPDFQWGLRDGASDAQINITFYSANYPGDTPRVYGPYRVTQATQYINPRIRGRLMAIQATSNNSEFWRLGRIRYRWAPSGRI